MISAMDLKKGDMLKLEENLCLVVEVSHGVAAGRVGAMTRIKLRNIKTGASFEKSCKQDEKFEEADLVKRRSEYLYKEGEKFSFMDSETYEQFTVDKGCLGKAAEYLTEGLAVYTLCSGEEMVSVQLPSAINVRVLSTMPPMKGEKSGNMGKQAVLETGAEIMVPLFIKDSDLIKIDTLTGEYIERILEKKEKPGVEDKKQDTLKKTLQSYL